MEKARTDTKILLAETLFDLLTKKPFQKISVNDLCEKCGIHRSTFYRHFEDKYQLLHFCLNKISEEMDNSKVVVKGECEIYFKLFLSER